MPDNRILFCGDPHGCFANVIRAVHQYRPEAVVLLGDYNLELPLENYLRAIIGMTKVFWIPGNHDYDSQSEYEHLFHSALAYNNLHLKVVDVGGLRIAGLGGIFLSRVWMPGQILKWKDKNHWLAHQPSSMQRMPLHIRGAIWHHDFERMKQEVKADLLVTHEAPSSHRYGFAAIDELAEAIGAWHVVHGHHHVYYHARLNNGIAVTGAAIGGIVNLAGEQLVSPFNPGR
jgi:predicted phosphohydrolase